MRIGRLKWMSNRFQTLTNSITQANFDIQRASCPEPPRVDVLIPVLSGKPSPSNQVSIPPELMLSVGSGSTGQVFETQREQSWMSLLPEPGRDC